MSSTELTYVVITPVRNELANLERLAGAIEAQVVRPLRWVVVDTGSEDGTDALAAELAQRLPWLEAITLDEVALARGGPIVRAFEAGVSALDETPDVVVKLDADVSFGQDYFAALLSRFAAHERLGMASGTLYEVEHGEWKQRHVTGSTVWGAARAYRWQCLQEVMPLEQRMGWDGVDEFRANARGWSTQVFLDLPLRHHRREGERDGSMRRARIAEGRAARYLGYRPWYLVLRALWHARNEPGAIAMVWGYVSATVRREPRLTDAAARSYLRNQQSMRRLPLRVLEAAGRRRSA